MISVAEALDRITAGMAPVAAEQVPLSRALGRVTAEPVAARLTQPPAALSAMDGYAVRSVDLANGPAELRLVGISAAGHGFAGPLGAGEAARVFTGAPLPAGADAVVIQEEVSANGDAVFVSDPVPAGAFVRPEGMDFRAGETLIDAGRALTVRDLGLLAAMNVPWLRVRRRPRVALLATGDELSMPGDPLARDGVVSSNSVAMSALVRVLGGEPIDLGIAGDDRAALAAMLDGARGADLLLTIGGASVGDRDLVRAALGERDFALTFHRVAMRPGKPLLHGHLDGTPVIGLPGNPVSAGVTALLFVGVALRILLGRPARTPPLTARLGVDLPANDRRQDYLRAGLRRDPDGRRVAVPFDRQDSSLVSVFARAGCLVVRPPLAPPARTGDETEIVLFPTAAEEC